MKIIKKLLENEIISYMFFGFLTTILNFGLFFLCEKILYFNKSFINNFIAWGFCIVFAYITANKFTFKMKFQGIKIEIMKIFQFIFSRLFSLLLEEIGIFILIDSLEFNKLLMKAFLGILVIILNYILSKFIIFKKEKELLL